MSERVKVRDLAVTALQEIMAGNAYANLCLNQIFKKNKVSPANKGIMTRLVYGNLEKWRPVEYQLQRFLTKPLKKRDALLGIILHAALYELLYTSVPHHAVVNEYVGVAKTHGHRGWGGLVNGVLRQILREKEKLTWPNFEDEIEKLIFEGSYPLWLGELWRRQRGDEDTLNLLTAMNRIQPLSLRVNTLKISVEQFKNALMTAGFKLSPGCYAPHCLQISDAQGLFDLDFYRQGCFTVESEASQLAVLALEPTPGQEILDMCAAPGGKATYIAELMENRGRVVAADIHLHKIKLIEEQAKRLGISVIEAVLEDGAAWGKKYPSRFDSILLDAPCSGLGVLGRKPDARHTKKREDILTLQAVQRKLIDGALLALKPGGCLVYSTCTLTQAENEANRQYILTTYPQMRPKDLTFLAPPFTQRDRLNLAAGFLECTPNSHGTDGFFIASFIKEGA